jgi:hypothetical protein
MAHLAAVITTARSLLLLNKLLLLLSRSTMILGYLTLSSQLLWGTSRIRPLALPLL